VQYLISAGADVNARHDEGWLPLEIAIYMDSLEIVQCLISAGADVNARDEEFGRSPLHCSAYTAFPNEADSLEIMKDLISAGADVHAKNNEGGTPLCVAVEGYSDCHADETSDRNFTEVAQCLISAGADVQTALDFAMDYEAKKELERLTLIGGQSDDSKWKISLLTEKIARTRQAIALLRRAMGTIT
jgi:ankyrin repeat protein